MLFGLLASLVTTVGVALALMKWVKHLQFRRYVNKIPGSDGLPLIGDSLRITPDDLGYFTMVYNYCRQHADRGIVKLWLGPEPAMYVFKAETVEQLLNSSKHMGKHFLYRFFNDWLGNGLLISTGSKWFARRRLITPTFHFKILEQFVHVFNEQAAVLIEQLDKKAGGPGFDVQPFIYRYMLDVICETAMGVKVHAQLQPESKYVNAVYRKSSLHMHRTKFPWLWPEIVFRLLPAGREDTECLRILHGFTRKVIAERKAELESRGGLKFNVDSTGEKTGDTSDENLYVGSKRRRLAFIDMLLETSMTDLSLTMEGIQEEVDTFMFEGHDTTASGAVWILYMLACYPELQVKVQQEIDSVLGSSDRAVTVNDVNLLTYTECFIKETFRLYTPVPWYGRKTSEPCTIGGYSIPEGVAVTVFAMQLHRDPEHFPDPETFDPDRWMNDSTASRHPYCYVPFSAGIRNCIGQRFAMLEEKVVLCHLMRRYTVSVEGKREDLIPCASLIMKPLIALPLHFTMR